MITAERGEKSLTRHGIEEYVSDCVIVLDHRVIDDLSTRRLRVVKYRGTSHGTNEYPFLIDEHGITVLPITSLGLRHGASEERLSTGLAELDAMLTGKGYFRGSSIFVTGGPGTGKTTIGAHFADATCRRGERCLYFSFEESPGQLVRNMRSAGIELQPWIDQGLLECHASRPSLGGLEMHLAVILKAIQDFSPSVVIVDPLSSLLASGTGYQSAAMMLRLVDYIKSKNVTALFLSLQETEEPSQMHISSIMDTWIVVRNPQIDTELKRRLHVVKARGMAHSNQVRRMEITSRGVRLTDLSLNPGASAGRRMAPDKFVQPELPGSERWDLRLYVAGQTDKSLRAINNLNRICQEHLEGRYSIQVIDLLEHPSWPRGTKSSHCLPWCVAFPNP